MRALMTLGILMMAGCGMTATQVRERELCYSRAEASAQKRVDQECPERFSSCAAADDILAELRVAQEACP